MGAVDRLVALGVERFQAGDAVGAEEVFRRVVELAPGHADARAGLGVALRALGRFDEASEALEAVLAVAPEHGVALNALGVVRMDQGLHAQALELFDKALAADPGHLEAACNRGAALKALDRADEAVAAYEQALGIGPDDPDTLFNLGNALIETGRCEEAARAFGRAGEASPGDPGPGLGRVLAHIPPFHESEEAVEAWRGRFSRELKLFEARLDLSDPLAAARASDALGRFQPFYLPYQGRNDKELMSAWGGLAARIQAAAFPRWAEPLPMPPLGPDGRVRVAFASGFFRNHSVWKIPLRGWALELDREKFDTAAFSTSALEDEYTVEARQAFGSFTALGHDFEGLCRAVRAFDPHVLVYPEVGMDPVCARLSALRLAPVQCVSLGHPETTGLPVMDAYLSSALMEPENGRDFYTERLVPLPNLGVCYKPLAGPVTPASRDELGLGPGETAYFCPQSLFKLSPRHDALFARIARRVPGARFFFIANRKSAAYSARFLTRLGTAFAGHGLDVDKHVRLLPWQDQGRYQGLHAAMDVFLDAPGWSGFNTCMEALIHGLPPLTLPGAFMRARHAYAVCRMAGLDECLTRDEDEYVAKAAALAGDPEGLARLKAEVRQAAPRTHNDLAPVRALEDFLLHAAESGGSPRRPEAV